jgi:hypothetical protein
MAVVRRAVVVVAGLVVFAAVGAGTGSTARLAGCVSLAGEAACAGSPEAPFVTPDEAKAAMTALWNERERANDRRDMTGIDGVTTGSALLAEHYSLAAQVCGCSTWLWTKGPRTIRGLTVFLPRETNYPLYFLAQVLAVRAGVATPAQGNSTALVLVTREAADQPWRIAMQLWDTGYEAPGTGLPSPDTDVEGYDTLPAGAPAGAAKWPEMLAAYYRRLKQPGPPPTTAYFMPGPLTTGTDLALRQQGYNSGGAISHYAFTVANRQPWLIGAGGTELACADVLETATQTPARPNTVFVQHDGPGQAWGADLDSGYYSKVIATFEWPVCIAKLAGDKLDVIGPTNGSVPIHNGGVPAKLSPGMTGLA